MSSEAGPQWSPLVFAAQAAPYSVAVIVAVRLLVGLVPATEAFLAKEIFDSLADMVGTGASVDHGLALVLAYVAARFAGELLPVSSTYAERRLEAAARLRGARELSSTLVGIARLDLYERPAVHNRLQLAFDGAERAPAQSVSAAASLGQGMISVVSLGAVVVIVGPWLGALILLGAAIQAVVALSIAAVRVQAAVRLAPHERRLSYLRFLMTDPAPVKELKASGAERRFQRWFVDKVRQTTTIELSVERTVVGRSALGAVPGAGAMGVLLVLVVARVSDGRATVGDLALLLTASQSLQVVLGAAAEALAMSSGAHKQFAYFADFVSDVEARPEPGSRKRPAVSRDVSAPPAVEFRSVWFRYDGGPWVLRDASFTIESGQVAAIVGENGAGKSTIIKLIAGLRFPQHGQVLVGGQSTEDADPAQLRDLMSIMFQDFTRFDISLLHNINLASSDDLSALPQVARRTGIDRLAERLTSGYETEVTLMHGTAESGTDFSGGQWQRIALSRLLARPRPLHVLDEPTAALDPEAELELIELLREDFKGRTIVFVTHRLPILRLAAEVVLIAEGQIVDTGAHHELMRRQPRYSAMVAGQERALRVLASDD